jgi:hypothetical protein
VEWKKSRRRRSRKEVWGGGEDGNGAAMIEERGRGNGKDTIDEGVCVGCLFLRTPSRAPYRTPPACANRAAYPDPPPVVPDPESIDAQAAYR